MGACVTLADVAEALPGRRASLAAAREIAVGHGAASRSLIRVRRGIGNGTPGGPGRGDSEGVGAAPAGSEGKPLRERGTAVSSLASA